MKFLLVTLLMMCLAVPVMAGDTIVDLPLWPGLAPGETTTSTGDSSVDPNSGRTFVTNVTSPHLYIYMLPDDKPKHPAVLIFPGGGYKFLTIGPEGREVAEWLNSLGYVAAVLYYRCPDNRDGAFQDAERAMSILRGRANEFAIDPNNLGVIGFSAGGHLAARLSSQFETRAYTGVDPLDTVNCRPDFTMLIYPAYLVGNSTSDALAPEVQPVWNSPPAFLVQTKQDPYFDIIPYSVALKSTAISQTTFAYDGGGHGYGLHPSSDEPVAKWPSEAAAWLAHQVCSPQMP